MSSGLFSIPAWRVLWGSGLLGNLGANVSIFALPLYVHAVTGSVATAGVTSAVALVAGLLVQVFAGALVDRHQIGRFLVTVNLGRSVIWGLAVVAAAVRDDLWWTLLIAYVIGVGSQSALNAASGAAVRLIVPPELRAKAVAQNQARFSAVRLIAPLAGAPLFTVHELLPFVTEAVLFVAATVLLGRMDSAVVHRNLTAGRSTAFLSSVVEGFRYAWRIPFIRAVILFGLCGNFAIAAVFQSTTLILVDRGESPFLVSAVGVAVGLSTLLLSTVVGWTGGRLSRRPLVVASVLTFTVGAIGVGVIGTWPVVAVVGCAVVAASAPGLTAHIGGQLASGAPPELQGRVMAATGLSSGLLAPLVPLFGAFVAVPLNPWVTVVVTVALYCLGCAALFRCRVGEEPGEGSGEDAGED